jgi:biopolymer transport protein ExbD
MRLTKPQWRPSAARHRASRRSVIDVSGFAGIMLALLFLTMFCEMYPIHRLQPPVDMAVARHSSPAPDALREDALVLCITRDGSLYFLNARIAPYDLPQTLREAVERSGMRTLYLKADARPKYADIKTAVDRVREAGLTNITFLTEAHP